MDEENKKIRRTAKRERINDVISLVHFCKRRDPRVKAQRERDEKEAFRKQVEKEQEVKRKKALATQAQQAWKEQAGQAMAEYEEEDRIAGRVRLADLDDDYDYGGGKRGRKKKKNRSPTEDDEDEDEEEDDDPEEEDIVEENGTGDGASEPSKFFSGPSYYRPVDIESEDDMPKTDAALENASSAEVNGTEDVAIRPDSEDKLETDATLEDEYESSDENGGDVDDLEEDFSSEVESESEPEPDIYVCECCRKEFKSEGQMENHMKSKKHKEAFKKFQAKKKKEKATDMEGLLEELALDP
jgi:DnaJ family protein A protein 5